MQLKSLTGLGILLLGMTMLGVLLPWADMAAWASMQQQAFHDAMSASLRAIQAGESTAIWTLCLVTAAYGFMHALGPGHGKVLLGGAAIASGATLRRMIALSLLASLAQSGCAILLVALLLKSVQLASSDAIGVTEQWLEPISRIAIAAIGSLLFIRGIKAVRRLSSARVESEHHACGCGHDHGVSLSDVKSLQSPKEVVLLIGSIALRPCTGALFLLVVAARFDMFLVGVLATLTMGLGTALFNIMAASSGYAARRLAYVGDMAASAGPQSLSAGLHIFGGMVILGLSLFTLLPVPS